MRPVGPRLGAGRGLAVCFRRGRCWHHPGTLRRGRPQAAGENARPTLRPGTGGDTKAAALCQARRRAGASIGLCAGGGDHAVGAAQQRRHRPLRRGRAAAPGAVARIRYIVGRAFTPAGEGCRGVTLWFCVSAAPQGRGGLRHPGRVLARSCAAPLSRRTPTAPLAGEPSRRRLPKASPARGGGCAVRRRRRGALPACGGDILQNSAGHCPANPAVPRASKRRAKTPALQSRCKRGLARKRQPFAVPAGGPMQASAPT